MNEESLTRMFRYYMSNGVSDDTALEISENLVNANKSECRSLVRRIKKILKSSNYKPSFKLNALKIIEICISTDNINFIIYVSKKLLSKLKRFAEYRKESSDINRGETMFIADSDIEKQASAEFLVTLLRCIEHWARKFDKDTHGNPTEFAKLYIYLKNRDVVFPPMESYSEMPREIRKDLHRCRKIIKTISMKITHQHDIAEIKPEISSLKNFHKFFEIELVKFIENGSDKLAHMLIETNEEIYQTIMAYRNLKNHGKVVHKTTSNHMDIIGIRLTGDINDIAPKPIPRADSPDSFVQDSCSEKFDVSFSKVDFNISIDQGQEDWTEINNEYCYAKEKLAECEDLISNYKNDLLRLQMKYLETVEEREEIKLSMNNIMNDNVEFKQENGLIIEKIRRLEVDNLVLREELDAYKSQNQFLKFSIKSLQDEYTKSDKIAHKNLKYIENIENINKALMITNRKLQNDIEKYRDIEKDSYFGKERSKSYEFLDKINELDNALDLKARGSKPEPIEIVRDLNYESEATTPVIEEEKEKHEPNITKIPNLSFDAENGDRKLM